MNWVFVLDIVILLAAAIAAGTIMTRLRQSPIVGFLIAGTLVGPNALGLVSNDGDAVSKLAELGVALLLFSIGLEFSWRRLMSFGRVGLGGGTLQVLFTIVLFMALALAMGVPVGGSYAIGAAVALSSTAVVLRVLRDRNDLDSNHGKNALGILLMQDVAVVPLVLILAAFGGTGGSKGGEVTLNSAALAAVVFLAIALVPRALNWITKRQSDREIPVLLAVTACVSASWAAHALGISPSLGAFAAGLILAESPFADQIRADVAPFRTVFVTLFFASVGMLAEPAWVGDNLLAVVGAAFAFLFGKALIVYATMRVFRQPHITSIATGLTIANTGEFTFVLTGMALAGGLLADDAAQLVNSATLVLLVVTPALVTRAPKLARKIAKRLIRVRALALEERQAAEIKKLKDHFIVVGYGDAGEAATRTLESHGECLILEINPKLATKAKECGARTLIGDATSPQILATAGVASARALVIAVPDARDARIVVRRARELAPHVPIVVRSRYHLFAEELLENGADIVVDEEQITGTRLGEQALLATHEDQVVVVR